VNDSNIISKNSLVTTNPANTAHASKEYIVNFSRIMPPSTMSATDNGSHYYTFGFNHTSRTPPSTMAATEDTGILNEAISIITLSIIVVLFFLAIATSFYVLAVMASFYLPMSITSVLNKTFSGERLQPKKTMNGVAEEDCWGNAILILTAVNGVLLTVGSIWSACYAGMFSGMWFLESMWHGLGVGATVTGLLLMVELVVIALCCYIANAGERKQEVVKVRTFVDSATQN